MSIFLKVLLIFLMIYAVPGLSDGGCKEDVCDILPDGGYTAGGGDPLIEMFERAKKDAAKRVRRSYADVFNGSVDKRVLEFLQNNSEALAQDIETSRHLWTDKEQGRCAFTNTRHDSGPTIKAPILFSTVSCRATSFLDAVGLLIHESTHHLYGAGSDEEDEQFARDVTHAVLSKVLASTLAAWCEANEHKELELSSHIYFIELLLKTLGSFDCNDAQLQLEKLKTFAVTEDRLQDLSPLTVLQGAHQLKSLELKTSASNLKPIELLNSLQSLQSLRIENCRSLSLESLFYLPSLQNLGVDCNMPWHELGNLPIHTNLKALSIQQPLHAFSALMRLVYLESLSLSVNLEQDSDLYKTLANLSRLNALKLEGINLELSQLFLQSLNDLQLGRFNNLNFTNARLPKLKHLGLLHTKAVQLEGLQFMNHLKTIRLQQVGFLSPSSALWPLSQIQELKLIDLSETNVDTAHLKEFCEGASFPLAIVIEKSRQVPIANANIQFFSSWNEACFSLATDVCQ